jgi:hypothetical protein
MPYIKHLLQYVAMNKRYINYFTLPAFALVLAIFGSNSGAAKITVQKNENSGLYSWVAESEGFSIELVQLLPDFVRAIYMKHDFPDAEVDQIAGYCVFGTIIKNTSQQQLDYDVANWYYTDKNGNDHPVKTKTQWLDQWRKAGVTFSWTLLPDKGTFYKGDWQQGFTTVELPPGSKFSLTYKWSINGIEHTDKFEGLRCAPEQLSQQ